MIVHMYKGYARCKHNTQSCILYDIVMACIHNSVTPQFTKYPMYAYGVWEERYHITSLAALKYHI